MSSWIWFLGLALLGLWLFFRWFEFHNVYQPSRTWWTDGRDLSPRWQSVDFTTTDGVRINAWFFPAPTPSPFPRIVFLISHGNGGNVSHRLEFYRLLLDLGVNVLAYDYRGYGQSQGRPSEPGTYLDAEAALAWLRSQGFAENEIVAHGESLGGGIASELALRHPGLRGLILRSTFTSIPDIGAELFPWLPVRTLSRIRYDTVGKLPRIQVPVLLLHSHQDTLIPFHHATRNLEAARSPKRLAEILGDHNDQPEASPDLYLAALRDFLLHPPSVSPAPPPASLPARP